MNRGVQVVIEYLKANSFTRVRDRHGVRGENITVWNLSNRERIKDGARDLIEQTIGILVDRPTRAKLDTTRAAIIELMTQGFIVVSAAINAEIHFSAMNSESVPSNPEKNSFIWRGFFEIKGQVTIDELQTQGEETYLTESEERLIVN